MLRKLSNNVSSVCRRHFSTDDAASRIAARAERRQRMQDLRNSFSVADRLSNLAPISPNSLRSALKDPAVAYNRKTRMMSFDPTWRDSLVDSYGREHSYLRISLTERCNLRCQYCMPEEGVQLQPEEKMLTKDEFVSIANLFVRAGVDKIRLTGGEPTIHPDFEEIITRIGRADGLRTLAITTNGLKLDSLIPTLKAAKVNAVNVSLDTLQSDKFLMITRRNGFEKVFDGLTQLVEASFCQVKVNCVVMRGVNDQEVLDFVRLTKELPIHVRFIEFMPFADNSWSTGKMVSKNEILASIAEEFPSLRPVKDITDNETAKLWQVEGHAGAVGVISSMSDKFCSSCNRIRLTADGHLKNCLFGMDEFDVKTPMRAAGPRGDWEEDLLEVVKTALAAKKAAHGGMDVLSVEAQQKRHMVRVGG